MPVETIIDADAGLITYKATGDVPFSEMQEAFESIFTNPEFRSGMNALCHAKNARLTVTVLDVQNLIQLLGQYSAKRGKGFRVAVLVRSNEDFGLSSLFEVGTAPLPFEVQVFRNSQEAYEWLGVAKV